MDQFSQGNEIEDDFSVTLDNSRANWTPSQDQYFLELLLSHVHKGNKTGKVFTRLAWADMTEQFNNKFGFKYDLEVLKNRYKRFKKQYYEIKAMVSQNGFQWDGTLNMITANDKTWDEYIKAHPDAHVFRKKVAPCYNDLCIIYGHAVADGRYSLSCFDNGFEYEENASKELDDHTSTSKGMDNQTPPTPSQSKIDWSPMMDRVFVELMLDQVRKGNKVGRTFTRQSWGDMAESFNDRFGCHYGKVVLKNRFTVLRRHYDSINVLLGKEGCSWDKREHKVVADDKVWQKCIRANHKFRLYRVKSMPFYSGMCIVCRDEATAGCKPNLESKSFDGKDSVPDPNASLPIDGENNFTEDAQPLPIPNSALHVGGENTFTKDTIFQPLNAALHIDGENIPNPNTAFNLGGENSFTRDTQHLPNSNASLNLGGENSFTRYSQPLPNAAFHLGSANNFTRDTQPVPNRIFDLGGENTFTRNTIIQPVPNAALHIGGENNFTRDTIVQPLHNAALHIGGENNFTRDTIIQPLHNAALNLGGGNNFTDTITQPLTNATLFIGGENNFTEGARPLPSADNEGGEKNITRGEGGERNSTRKTQPLKKADKEPLLPSVGKNVSSQKKRHQTKLPPTLNEPKKARNNYNKGMSVALKNMAVAVTSLTKKTKKEDNFSVGNVITVLQAIPDLDDDLILDACDFLEDEKRARMFLALPAHLRKKWLLKNLRS
ncbi:hypothetical protein TSUD_21490 [Trifolium subterraneum]|uniref:Myb/SANT-like domain-containing protein n=1 Tax=Trifolium subterraneum TaxID=3900 RepID=A0A2Z6MV54_TRISU|nr:hypothetical protein TSUD_21490 [Trifolium subterraneum]